MFVNTVVKKSEKTALNTLEFFVTLYPMDTYEAQSVAGKFAELSRHLWVTCLVTWIALPAMNVQMCYSKKQTLKKCA